MPTQPKIELVYRPKSPAEAARRISRGEALRSISFVHLPHNPPSHKVAFEYGGRLWRVEAVEAMFNDACLMDAISDWGKDGPLYSATLTGVMAELWPLVKAAYAGVELPPAYRFPE